MATDKLIYAAYYPEHQGGFMIGDAEEFRWLFEKNDLNFDIYLVELQRRYHSVLRFGVAPDPVVVARYQAATEAYDKALHDLWDSLQPIQEMPVLLLRPDDEEEP